MRGKGGKKIRGGEGRGRVHHFVQIAEGFERNSTAVMQ